jgi:hypothetical protein
MMNVGQAAEVLDPAEGALQLRHLPLQLQAFLLRHAVEAAVLSHLLHLLQALDGLLDGLEVREHSTQPAVVDERHRAAHGFLADDLARLALRADEQQVAAVGRELAREFERFLVHRKRALEVDDVDLVAMAENERRHLRVPIAGLMPEMDPGFQHLTHGH